MKKAKYIYKVVFQIKRPKGKWYDKRSFATDSSFVLKNPEDKDRISRMKRELKQDLPKWENRTIKRRVLKE